MRWVELLLNLTSPPGNTCVPLCRPIQDIAVQLLTLTTVSSGLGEGAESGVDPVGSSREYVGARRTSNQCNRMMAITRILSGQFTGYSTQKFELHMGRWQAAEPFSSS